MASIFSDNISFIGNKPNFERDTISSVALLLAETPEQRHYPYGHIVFCEEDGLHYKFNYDYNADEQSDDAWNETTGWFIPLSEKVDLSPLETALTENATDIATEVARAQNAEQTLTNSINSVKATVKAETSRACAAEQLNADAIDAIETTLNNSPEMLNTLHCVAKWVESDSTGSAALIANQDILLNYTAPCSFPASENSEYNCLCYKFVKEIFIYDTSQILNGDITGLGINLVCRNNDTYGWRIYFKGTNSDGSIVSQNLILAAISGNPEDTHVLKLVYNSSLGGKLCGYMVVDWSVIEDGVNMNGLFTWYLNRRATDLRYSPVIKAYLELDDVFCQLDEQIVINSDRITEIRDILGFESTKLEMTETIDKYVNSGGNLVDGAGAYGCYVYDVTGLKGLLMVTSGVSRNNYVCVCRVEDSSGNRLNTLVNTGSTVSIVTNKQTIVLNGNAVKCYVSVPISSGVATKEAEAVFLINSVINNSTDIVMLKQNLSALEEDNRIPETEYKNPSEYVGRLEAIAYTGDNPVMSSNQYTHSYRYTLFELEAGIYRLTLNTKIAGTVVAGLLNNAEQFIDGGTISETLLSGSVAVGTNKVVTLETGGYIVLFGQYGSDTPTESNIYYYASLEKIYYSKVKEKIEEIPIINESLNGVSYEVFGKKQKADLSAVNVSGYLTATGEIGDYNYWVNGKIPVPDGAVSVVFNNLPSAEYSSAVSNFFVDADGAIMTDTRFTGNKILGCGVVEKNIPNGAKELYMTAVNSSVASYDVYFKMSQGLSDRVAAIEENGIDQSSSYEIVVPDKIYAVVGDTLQIFYDSIFNVQNLKNYQVSVLSAKGKAYPRYYEYLPGVSDIGSTDITFNLHEVKSCTVNIAPIVVSKTCRLITVDKLTDATSINVVCVGDSTTQGGQWPKELARRIYATGGTPAGLGLSNINICGRRQTTVNDKICGWEGTGGWTWGTYVSYPVTAFRLQVVDVASLAINSVYKGTNGAYYQIVEINVTDGVGNVRFIYTYDTPNKETLASSGVLTKQSSSYIGDDTIAYTSYEVEKFSPFYINDSVDFTDYANRYCNGRIDCIVVHLGINDLLGEKADITATVSSIMTKVRTFLNKYNEQFPYGKVLLVAPPKCSATGGMGANYNATRMTVEGTYNRQMYSYHKALIELAGSEEYSGFVRIVDTCGEFDTPWGYPYNNKAVNVRVTGVTEPIGTNGVHPNGDGYNMVADSVYRTLTGVYNE